ncbi:hypothetical protein DFH27DRAFT_569820 [Peziza echinospora]|nr:hypothetical protein DFH27DRAFT_569820 [Peziza echinospora]
MRRAHVCTFYVPYLSIPLPLPFFLLTRQIECLPYACYDYDLLKLSCTCIIYTFIQLMIINIMKWKSEKERIERIREEGSKDSEHII